MSNYGYSIIFVLLSRAQDYLESVVSSLLFLFKEIFKVR